jgi:hypothetical protein
MIAETLALPLISASFPFCTHVISKPAGCHQSRDIIVGLSRGAVLSKSEPPIWRSGYVEHLTVGSGQRRLGGTDEFVVREEVSEGAYTLY